MSIRKFNALKNCVNNGILGYNKRVHAYLVPNWCGNFCRNLLIYREHDMLNIYTFYRTMLWYTSPTIRFKDLDENI